MSGPNGYEPPIHILLTGLPLELMFRTVIETSTLFQEQGDVPRVRDPAAAAGLRGQDRIRHRKRTQGHPPLQLRIHLQVGQSAPNPSIWIRIMICG